jgi:vancomycin permeability regulator SanA
MKQSHIGRFCIRVATLTMGVFLLASILLSMSGLRDALNSADVVIVMGNTISKDGTPSARLAARLDRAAELFHDGLSKNIIVSGGVGREGFDEAIVMKKYLVSKGVLEDQIHVDSKGVNTAATAKNVAIIMRDKQWSSALVVSQYFHIPRCRLAIARAGVNQIYSTHAHYFELRDIYSIAREVIGYAAYFIGMRN